MNLKNLLSLTIRALDFNRLPQQPELVKQLRKLTLNAWSGMNRELDTLLALTQQRQVKAQVILAYRNKQLVGWALLSKERSSMAFYTTHKHFESSDGMLLEIFIDPDHRRQGIGTEIMKVARRKAKPYRLCVAPWDERSEGFYRTFPNFRNKWL